jgi:ribose/xylose/arabinose/galactoside ABC-type transport system permease subunit
MAERYAGLVKIMGITILLVVLWLVLCWKSPISFLTPNNLENLLRRTALYGVLGIGVAFVIISSGIDLSIGSLVCLSACLLALFLEVSYVPVGAIDVMEVRADSQAMVVNAGSGFEVGDELWYYKDRRKKGLVKVTSINQADQLGAEWQLIETDPVMKTVNAEEDGSAVATLSRTFSVKSLAGIQVNLDANFPPLKHNDKILFVHSSSSSREKVVDQRQENGTIVLSDEDSGLNNSFRAVPIKKTALMSIPMALLSVTGIALVLGILHGVLITKMSLQPFVVTLCGLLVYRGLSRWLTSDQTVGFIEYQESLGEVATGRWETGLQFMPVKVPATADAPETWQVVWDVAAGAKSFGIPYSFFIFVLITLTAIVFLNLTVWGRHMQAVGRNEEAARYSGISTNRVTILAYVLCAVLTGIGGVMFAIDSNSIAPSSFGNFFELYAIAAAVLGGCSLRGGEGSILGVVVGTALMQTLYNSIVLLKIPDELEFTIIGAVILFGVIADELMRRLAGRFR